MTTIEQLEKQVGLSFLDYQYATLTRAVQQDGPAQRLCLYYKTGAGKSYTSLACVRLWGHQRALVIAPPSTHAAWTAAGLRFGVQVEVMSHAKFRQPATKLSREVAVIADEMHLFGGHKGKGWAKLDRLAAGLKAPLILASATPNYNDADRVYCIQHVLDPLSCRGGFLQFLYQNCETEQNPFAMMPDVKGFLKFGSAAEYLASLPYVEYLPDDLVYTIDEVDVPAYVPAELRRFGYNRQAHKMIGSQIEETHTVIQQALIAPDGTLTTEAYTPLLKILDSVKGPVLIFANHSTVAEAAHREFGGLLVTGKTSTADKARQIEAFNTGRCPLLIGTASLATGTDGMDKVCNTLVILDDTPDDSMRRQLIGRIMPRGVGGDASIKKVYRFNLLP